MQARRSRRFAVATAALAVVVSAVAVVLGLTGSDRPAASRTPVDPGPLVVPAVLAAAGTGVPPGTAGLRRALAAALRDPALGRG
ncbi:MAG: hypothetical protein ACR2J0_06375, partial [Mycobacteriales bacterium]